MTHELDHEQAAALLPWLANGTLDGAERERVERHVRGCLPCRAELAEQTRLRALVQRRPIVHLSADAGFERLRSRLAHARGPRVTRRTLWAAAAVVALAGIGWMLAIGVSGLAPRSDDGEYRTLSDSGAHGALVDVIFADGVRESDMRALLEELDAEIVAGPSRSLGRYTLELAEPRDAPLDVDSVVRRLLADERVRFAAPTYSAPPASDER